MLQEYQMAEEGKRALEEFLKESENDVMKLAHNEGLLNTGETNWAPWV